MEESWKNRVKDAIENGIIYPDGHQIVDPSFYEGFNINHLIEVHKSDFSSPKTVIFGPDGEPQEETQGVYNLAFLYWVAQKSGVQFRDALGRGSQARNIVDALVDWSGADPDVFQ
tara:strand:+ start:142 stop:486 length:345 start_codon:yes stop_codon:yes gene_type:complete